MSSAKIPLCPLISFVGHQTKGNTRRRLRRWCGSTCSGSTWLTFIVNLNIRFGFPRMLMVRRTGNWQALRRQTSRRRDDVGGVQQANGASGKSRAWGIHNWLFKATGSSFYGANEMEQNKYINMWKKRLEVNWCKTNLTSSEWFNRNKNTALSR